MIRNTTPTRHEVAWLLLGALLWSVASSGCTADQRPEAPEQAQLKTPTTSPEPDPAPTPTPEPPRPSCHLFEPADAWPELAPEPTEPPLDVYLCDDTTALGELEEGRAPWLVDAPNPEAEISPYDDPIAVRGGMAIYRHAMDETVRVARLTPLLFGKTPPLNETQLRYFRENPRAAREAHAIWSEEGRSQWTKIRSLVGRYTKRDPAHLRRVLLRSGYLFVEEPFTAQMMFRRLRLDHLFSEEDTEIFLRRGAVTHRLERRDDDYVYTEGPRKGVRASLLVFDRVATDPRELSGEYAWDIDRLRRPLALRSFAVQGLSADRLTGQASLRGGDTFKATAFVKEERTVLALVVPPERRQAVLDQVRVDRRDAAIMEGILQSGEQMVDERLRFDEPRTEEGQQDGLLREVWKRAYSSKRRGYVVNGDYYPVYDRQGRPYVPQVCVDFIMDSPERWSGRWWRPKGDEPGRTEGFLDFTDLVTHRRRVKALLEFAREHPDKADLLHFDEGRRAPYRDKEGFYAMVSGMRGEVFEGDVLVIYGLRDDGRNHYHSFYVHTTDPMSNTPILLMANAGMARLQVWHDVMKSAPRRAIHYRLRFRPDWIDKQREAFEVERAEAR
ncbi:MAG: hypothetical protein CMH57_11795 [Myxococcales bacterium]|nr:hypothetical protein [Myxococcales bacterium]